MKPSMRLLSFRPTLRPVTSRIPSATQNPIVRNGIRRPQIAENPSRPTNKATFTSTAPMQKRKKQKEKGDMRITLIRYHLSHPLTPRPLHLSRTRSLRHWTIHRAWLLYLRKLRASQQLELERQYQSMRSACEALRLLDEEGMAVPEDMAGGKGADPGTLGAGGKNVGRLYREAMGKKGVWDSVPIEYSRIQTEFPGREGWNHGWTRG